MFPPLLGAEQSRTKCQFNQTNKTLQQVQQAYEQLKELRTTKAEESEKQLTLIAAERQEGELLSGRRGVNENHFSSLSLCTASYNTIQLYKNENDELRAEIAELRANGHSTTSPRASSRPSAGDKTRVTQLEEELAAVHEEKNRLAAELEAMRIKEHGDEKKKVQDRDSKWEKELARTVKAKDEEAAKALATLKMDREASSYSQVSATALILLFPLTQSQRRPGISAPPTKSSRPRFNIPSLCKPSSRTRQFRPNPPPWEEHQVRWPCRSSPTNSRT